MFMWPEIYISKLKVDATFIEQVYPSSPAICSHLNKFALWIFLPILGVRESER